MLSIGQPGRLGAGLEVVVLEDDDVESAEESEEELGIRVTEAVGFVRILEGAKSELLEKIIDCMLKLGLVETPVGCRREAMTVLL